MLKRKLTAAVLSMLMVCTAVPAVAYAAEDIDAIQEEQAVRQEDTEPTPEESMSSENADEEAESIPKDMNEDDRNNPDITEGDNGEPIEEKDTHNLSDSAEEDLTVEDSIEEKPMEKAVEENGDEAASTAETEKSIGEDIDLEIRTESEEVLFKSAKVDLGDTDLLFEEYANSIFYPRAGMSKKARKAPAVSAGSKLSGADFVIYTRMRERAAAVASGDESGTTIQFSFTELGIEDRMYSAQELGLTTPLVDEETGKLTQAAKDAIYAKLEYDFDKVTDSLVADCPYELYWSSGGFGQSASMQYSYNSQGVNFSSSTVYFVMYVDTKYRVDEADNTSADKYKTSAASNAAEAARQIVDNAAGMDDLEKLTYYKEKICDLVTYNHSAAEGGSQNDRGPWALIYVFDGDPDTNVVCEGYSEAFQYLGSLTDFDSGKVCVYSVTGTMTGATGAGPHKWNIVRMNDGLNYIADITNSDEDSVGSDGKLFLTGMAGSPEDCYVKEWDERQETIDNGDGSYSIHTYPGGSVTYVYDDEMFSVFSEEELTLSEHDYVYTDSGVTISSHPSDVRAKAGDSVEFTVEATGIDLHYQWQWSRDGERFTDCQSAGFDTDTFRFTMKSTMADRWYRCIVWNEDEEVCSEAANLTLNAPKITRQPEGAKASAGDIVVVSVEVSGENPVYQWQWSANGTTWKKCTGAGYDTDTFSFTMKESFANRQYRCVITDGSQKLYSQAAVIKLNGPEIVTQPKNVYAQNGSQVNIAIEAVGDDLNYQWQWSANGMTWKKCTAPSALTDTFSFTMKELYSGRMYRCMLLGNGVQVISKPATVTLVTAPAIIEQPQNVAAAAGKTVAFSVKVIGENPTYQWQVSSDGTSWKNCTMTGYDTSEFSFVMKSTYAGRRYRCIVKCEGKSLVSEFGTLTLKK